MSKDKIGICKLCLNTKKLCKSHIIPDYLWKPIIDEETNTMVSVAMSEDNKVRQTGVWDYLLCGECEQHINNFEKHWINFFNSLPNLEFTKKEVIQIKKVDYKMMKLFQLSILWRAGVSTQNDYKEISIAPMHLERMRNLILKNTVGKYYEYGCLMFLFVHEGKVMNRIMMKPTIGKKDGHTYFTFIFGGFIWQFIVSSHTNTFNDSGLFIREDNVLRTICYDYFNHPYLRQFIKAIPNEKINSAVDYYNKRSENQNK